MSYIVDSCNLPDKHDPHWIVQPPEGGLGGVSCEGNPRMETEFERDLVKLLKEARLRNE